MHVRQLDLSRHWRMMPLAARYMLVATLAITLFDFIFFFLVPNGSQLYPRQTLKDLTLLLSTGIVLTLLMCQSQNTQQPDPSTVQQYTHLVVEHSSDLILIYAPDCRLLYANPAVERVTGCPLPELMVTDTLTYVHVQDRCLLKTHFQAARNGTQVENIHCRLIIHDGSERPVQATCGPLYNEKGTFMGVQMTLRTIPDPAQPAQDLHHIQSQLMQQDRLATLGQLVADMAHELNNPLTSILGHTQLLLQNNLPATMRTDLMLVEIHTQRAVKIVANLLNFARNRKPQRTLTVVNEVITCTLELRQYHLHTHNIATDLCLTPDLPLINTDAFQLQQVILNLIVNAEQALTDPDWREHALQPAQLVIESDYVPMTQGSNAMIVVRVRDNGPGIPPEIRQRIFEPFFTTRATGTGLGLSISSRIIRSLGGCIHIHSTPADGTTVEILLPVYPETDCEQHTGNQAEQLQLREHACS